jgi:hypothetical protein
MTIVSWDMHSIKILLEDRLSQYWVRALDRTSEWYARAKSWHDTHRTVGSAGWTPTSGA